MVRPVRRRHARPRNRALTRAAIASASIAVLVGAAALTGCGSTLKHAASATADADVADSSPGSCQAVALQALSAVAERVYREGVASERTASAQKLIEGSTALRAAVEAGDASAARRATSALVATGHLTDLRIVRDGKTLLAMGGAALAPLSGTLKGADGKPIATFTTSVWSDAGLVAETDGIDEAQTIVRTAPVGTAPGAAGGARTLAGAFALPSGELPAEGTLTSAGSAYSFASFAGTSYPSGDPVRVYLVRSNSSLAPLCGASAAETQFATISHIAHLIYEAEAGKRTLPLVRRVQTSEPLLQAVAQRNVPATRAAIIALLNHHIVRIRVTVGGRVLEDVGGPFVLAPVSAPLRLNGRTIGTMTLSIQDDEGYKRLAARLAGLDVVMYMGPRLVKSTIGFAPGPVPSSGPFEHRGKSYRAYTFYATAFPSGPLRITDLIPIPYS
jgi:hypothetical protein